MKEIFFEPIGFSFDELKKDAEIEKYILDNVGTYHHPDGTCLMGAVTNPEAVVNHHCRVHGVENLFVIDASVMPEIPCANTNIPTIMLAERCVDWL